MNREELVRILEYIFQHPARIEQYLRYAAEKKLSMVDMLRIEHLKEFDLWENTGSAVSSAAGTKMQNPSLIEKNFRCGFHHQEEPFTTYHLRPGTQRVEQNKFLVATYQGAITGKQECNGLFYRVHVCPDCLFASSEEHHFMVRAPTGPRTFEKDFDPSPKVRQRLQETYRERQNIARLAPRGFGTSRTAEEALVSYELAIECARVFIETYPDRYAAFWLKTGEYALMAAQICRELNDGDRERTYLQRALHALQEGQIAGRGISTYLNVYRIVMLALHFDDLPLAMRNASRMMEDKIRQQKTLNPEEYGALTRYFGMSKNAIDAYREEKELQKSNPARDAV